MASTTDVRAQAKKAAFTAAYDAALKGEKNPQGAANKAYDNVVSKPKASAVNIYANAGRQQDRQQRLPDSRPKVAAVPMQEKTTAQKLDEAQQLYDAYVQSDEYKKKQEDRKTYAWMVASMNGDKGYVPEQEKDQKEQELKALVDHYTAQMKQEERQQIVDADLQELEGWDEQDRAALESYIINRNMDFANRLNPMADAGFGTADQKAAALIQKYGLGKVRQMAESLELTMNEEATQVAAKAGREGADSGFLGAVGHNAASVGANAVSGITGMVESVRELGNRTGRFDTLDPNNIGNLPAVYAGAVREETAKNISGDVYDENGNLIQDGGKLRQLGAYAYQGGMSAADSLARAALGGGAAGGAALAATGSFTQALSEASAQGATPAEAAALATVTAGIEFLSEKIPLDNLVDAAKAGGHSAKEIVKNALLQGGIEASTEEISLIGTTLAEAAILKEKAGYQQRIQELVAGGTPLADAQKAAMQELVQEAVDTAVVSFLSGGMSEVGASVAGNLAHRGMDADAQQKNAAADNLNATEKQLQEDAAPELTEQERVDQVVEETMAQLAKESPQEKPAEKDLTLERALEMTFGKEGNDQGSRADDLERLQAQEESLRGAADAYASAGDNRAAAEVEEDRQKYADQFRAVQDQEAARMDGVTDQDAPAEPEAPYPGRKNTMDPFQGRSWEAVGSRKVKAYMAENPEVKPYIQQEAMVMADELANTTKGERGYNEDVHYESGGENGWWGTKRHTSEDIAELRDSGMSYEQIDKGLNDIIEDHGKENSAAAKRVEIQLNDRLRSGYKSFMTGKQVQPNQEYIYAVNEAEANRAGQEAFDSLVQSAEKEHISMEDYANNESPIWRNVPYEDDAQKLAIMQETHARMVEKGAVVSVPGDIIQYTEQAYPDLRHVKKKERAPILKKAVNALKDNLRQFLAQMGNQTFEFEVNGKVLDAKLYSTGIKEVLEKVTQDKASMLYTSEEIFRNAEYLYSTPDYDGDTNVQRWNYFYTPVQIGEDVVGVRIAVRDMAKQRESQIYNWGIKKDASVGGVRDDSGNRKPYGASLDASNNIVTETQQDVKGTGAAEQNFAGTAAYEDLLSDDNVQDPRRGAVRSDEVPKYDAQGRVVSKFASNSMSSRLTPDSFTTTIKQMVADGYASHDVKSNDQSLREAAQVITDSGSVYDALQEVKEVAKQGRTSSKDVAVAELIYNHLVDQDGEQEQRMAADAWVTLTQLATNSGRATQIFSVFQRMTPDSQCMVLEKEVKLFAEKEKAKGHVPKDYVPAVDPGLMKDYRKAAEAVKKAKTEEAKKEAMEQLSFIQESVYQAEAAKMPGTFKAKWDAWRYMCMLGNMKTQVRNVGGNLAFRPYKDVKDAIGAGLERAFIRDQSKRTKAVLTFSEEDRQLRAWAKGDAKSEAVHDALKYSAKLGDDVSASKLEEHMQVFDTKALEAVRKFVAKVPGETDLLFKNGHYERSLAGFLKARGYTAADLQQGVVKDAVLNEARSYAIQEAMKATFNDCNAFSDYMSSIGRNPVHKDNPAAKVMNVVGEAVLPFRRTPANIVVRFEEYSPLGLINTAVKAAKHIRNGDVSAASVIDSLASSVTGSGAMVLGFLLAKGIGGFKITGSLDDEDELRQGHQEYAVEFSLGGQEYSYKIDWAAPANLPLFVGANLYNLLADASEENADVSKLTSFLYSTGTMFEPMLSLSCLSSLSDLFETGKYNEGNPLYAVAAQAATSYLTQGIPSLAKQTVQAFQKNKQTTFANSEDPLLRDLERTAAATGIVPTLKTDAIDAWGRVDNQGIGIVRALNAFLNPGTLKQIDNSALEQEVSRLNDSQPDSVSPPDTPKSISYTNAAGEKISNHRLTEEEYSTLAAVQGQTAKKILDEVLESDTYAAMTDQQKASVFRYVYDYAREKGRTAALDGYEGMSGWMQGLDGKEAAGILDKAITNAFTDAFEQLEKDPGATAAALDQAYGLISGNVGKTNSIAKTAAGRVKYFIEAKRSGIDAETFTGMYQKFRQIDSNPALSTSEKAEEWAHHLQKAQEAGTLTKAQKEKLKGSMVYYQQFRAETVKFDQMTESGIKADTAFDIGSLMDGITPQEGYSSVRDVQKAAALAGSSLSREEKTAAMKVYLSDAQDENLDLMMALGYSPEEYAAVYEIYANEKGTGKKRRTINRIQAELGVDGKTAKEIYSIYG